MTQDFGKVSDSAVTEKNILVYLVQKKAVIHISKPCSYEKPERPAFAVKQGRN